MAELGAIKHVIKTETHVFSAHQIDDVAQLTQQTLDQIHAGAEKRADAAQADHAILASARTYQIIRDIVPKKPYPTVEGVKAVLDELSLKMPAAKTAQPRDFMDIRFIEELDRSGFIDRLYR